MSENNVRAIAREIEVLLHSRRVGGRSDRLKRLSRALVNALGMEHHVPTVEARLTEKGTLVVNYCPYCYRRHSHPSDKTRVTAGCGRGEYVLEVEGE